MPLDLVQTSRLDGSWGAITAMARSDGSVGHPWLRKLAASLEPLRDLADAAHFLCMLHGRHPGVIDHALAHARSGAERGWIEAAAEAFANERAYLVRLVAAAGPFPSTPGQAESEAAAASQRHALDMLAQSDRAGCAAGAAIALALDWESIRDVMNAAGDRLGLTPPAWEMPLSAETATIVQELGREPAVERAMLFGAQQVFAQHRGLWDLLETRASAREDH